MKTQYIKLNNSLTLLLCYSVTSFRVTLHSSLLTLFVTLLLCHPVTLNA
jgi:hypothetical protein